MNRVHIRTGSFRTCGISVIINHLNLERFYGRVVDRIWIGGRFIYLEFFIAEADLEVRPCLLGMPFIAAINPSFKYKEDGSVECTMAFGSIDIIA